MKYIYKSYSLLPLQDDQSTTDNFSVFLLHSTFIGQTSPFFHFVSVNCVHPTNIFNSAKHHAAFLWSILFTYWEKLHEQ